MIAWYTQLKIHTRLFGILATMILLGTGLTILNIVNIIGINRAVNEIFRIDGELENLQSAQENFLLMDATEADFLLTGATRYLDLHASDRSLARMYLRNALTSAITAEEKTAIQGLRNQLEEYESTFLDVTNLYPTDREKALAISLEHSNREIQDVHKQAEALVALETGNLDAQAARAELETRISLIASAIGLVAFVILALLAAQSTLSSLILPLDRLNLAIFQAGTPDFDPRQLEKLALGEHGVARLARALLDLDQTSKRTEQQTLNRISELRSQLTEYKGEETPLLPAS